eukprot:jgi/Chlat1/9186/Chrsp97S09286
MTEYWVSQGNKWCDVCRVWISNNAASVRIHEGGKMHKEKLAKKLDDMHKRQSQDKKANEKAASVMGDIEAKARKQYAEDLKAMRELGGNVDETPSTSSAPGTQETTDYRSDKDRRAALYKASLEKRKRGDEGGGGTTNTKKTKAGQAGSKGPVSDAEKQALAAREAAKKRLLEREKKMNVLGWQ